MMKVSMMEDEQTRSDREIDAERRVGYGKGGFQLNETEDDFFLFVVIFS